MFWRRMAGDETRGAILLADEEKEASCHSPEDSVTITGDKGGGTGEGYRATSVRPGLARSGHWIQSL